MNKEFVKKMIKAKTLEYEAFKELFNEYAPQPVVNKVNRHADEIKDVIKETVFEIIKDSENTSQNDKCSDEENVSSKKNKKINVDFE